MSVRIAIAHQGSDAQAEAFFAGYGLGDVARVSDPDRALYRAFHLRRGGLRDVVGPAVWRRGTEAVAAGHGLGRIAGDAMQMPGVFVLEGGRVVKAFRHRTAADRPDYVAMAARASR